MTDVGVLIMPDLTSGSRGFRHSADSALRTLRYMGVTRRTVLEAAGPGSHPGSIVEQSPAPGALITATTVIHLKVAGVGGFHNLPFALRSISRTTLATHEHQTLGVNRSLGVDRVVASIDDQVLKLKHAVREAGGYLDLQPGRLDVARRYLREIFDVDPTIWSQERWYNLARVLRDIHVLAGQYAGIRTAFREVFQLDVIATQLRWSHVPFAPEATTRLGQVSSALGIDAVVGSGIPAEVELVVTFQVSTPAAVRLNLAETLSRERRQLYALLLPAQIHADRVVERWRVGPANDGVRLGERTGFGFLDQGAMLSTAGASQ